MARRWRGSVFGFTASVRCRTTMTSATSDFLPDADGFSIRSQKDMRKSGTTWHRVSAVYPQSTGVIFSCPSIAKVRCIILVADGLVHVSVLSPEVIRKVIVKDVPS